MHILQPKHAKLKDSEIADLLKKYNLSLLQLPKIKKSDPALPSECNVGDVIKIERKDEKGDVTTYRVVIQ